MRRDTQSSSLVDPGVGVVGPVAELSIREPEGDLLVGRLDGVGTVANVSADIDAVVTSDGAGLGVERLGGTEHLSAGEDDVGTLPDHAADGAGGGVLDETVEEALGGKISVVLLELLSAGLGKLHGDELEALGLEAGDDGTDEASLDTIGLDHDVGSLSLGGLHSVLFIYNKKRDHPQFKASQINLALA